jgi:hypothetical protein
MGLRRALDKSYDRGREDGRWGRPQAHTSYLYETSFEKYCAWAYKAGYEHGVKEQIHVVSKIEAQKELGEI